MDNGSTAVLDVEAPQGEAVKPLPFGVEFLDLVDQFDSDKWIVKGNDWTTQIKDFIEVVGKTLGGAMLAGTAEQITKAAAKSRKAATLAREFRMLAVLLRASAQNASLSVSAAGDTYRAQHALTLAFGKVGDIRKDFRAVFTYAKGE
jgi:hypothetical protein